MFLSQQYYFHLKDNNNIGSLFKWTVRNGIYKKHRCKILYMLVINGSFALTRVMIN